MGSEWASWPGWESECLNSGWYFLSRLRLQVVSWGARTGWVIEFLMELFWQARVQRVIPFP